MKGFKNTTRMKMGHSFPSSSTQEVKMYTRKTPKRKFAVGGYADGGDVPARTSGPKKPRPGIGGALSDFVESISGAMKRPARERQAKIDEQVDKASRGYQKGGKVEKGTDGGNALTQRKDPVTVLDKARGGTSPLAPGFAKGGKKGFKPFSKKPLIGR